LLINNLRIKTRSNDGHYRLQFRRFQRVDVVGRRGVPSRPEKIYWVFCYPDLPGMRMDEDSIVAGQLLGPADMCSSVSPTATPDQCIRLWLDLMSTCDQFLLAGLCREIGPDGDLRAAYRRWYSGEMEQHDRMMVHLMEEFSRRDRSTTT